MNLKKLTTTPLSFTVALLASALALAGGNVTASLPLFGLMVNGDDIAYASGTGWTFDGATVSLTNAGPFVLSTGDATFTSNVAVVAQSDCAVTFAHLEIFAGNHARLSPFTVAPGVSVALTLDGNAVLTAGAGAAAITVVSNATGVASLTIDADATDTTHTLSVTGGKQGAGIGGGDGETCGSVTINGGVVRATGGANAAGIGGGQNGAGGTVTISGGRLNVQSAGSYAFIDGKLTSVNGGAAIGGGYNGAGGTTAITGGNVTAVAGEGAQAIGHGSGAGMGEDSIALDAMRVFASASATEPVAAAERVDTCRGSWAKLEVCPHDGNGSSCPWCGVVFAYAAWAAENGISGDWDEKDALGIHNVFRYAFDKAVGAFENPPLLDIEIEGGNAVVKTPPVANSAGFALSVVESGDIAGATVTRRQTPDAAGRAVFAMEGAASRFYRLAATPGDANLGGVQLWEGGPYWAECNVGASSPEDYGYYFWWGDTVGYKRENGAWVASDGSSSNFSFGPAPTYGKSNSDLQSAGYIDSTGNLVAAHDAATAHLGAPWRMPTSEEIGALISNCTTTWITTNGVSGRLVTGKGTYANRSIFLPAAGYGYGSDLYYFGSDGYYWPSTPTSGSSYNAWNFGFHSGYFGQSDRSSRSNGQSVRPVRGFAE